MVDLPETCQQMEVSGGYSSIRQPTVDGRNPAKTHLGCKKRRKTWDKPSIRYQLVQDFFHQQYEVVSSGFWLPFLIILNITQSSKSLWQNKKDSISKALNMDMNPLTKKHC